MRSFGRWWAIWSLAPFMLAACGPDAATTGPSEDPAMATGATQGTEHIADTGETQDEPALEHAPGTIPDALAPQPPLGEVVAMAPPGGDGPTRYTLDPKYLGTHDDPGDVLGALLWDDRVFYVDPGFRLHELGAARPIAERVYAAPKVSGDGRALAYVVLEGGGAGTLAALHLRERPADARDGDADHDRVLDRSLFNFGELRFAPDGRSVLGFGTVNGGVSGLHVISLEGKHTCLTNCDLRTGTDWGDRHVELPARIEDVAFERGGWVVEPGATPTVESPRDDDRDDTAGGTR